MIWIAGLTKLDGKGGYTGEGRTVLMVVVGQNGGIEAEAARPVGRSEVLCYYQ